MLTKEFINILFINYSIKHGSDYSDNMLIDGESFKVVETNNTLTGLSLEVLLKRKGHELHLVTVEMTPEGCTLEYNTGVSRRLGINGQAEAVETVYQNFKNGYGGINVNY